MRNKTYRRIARGFFHIVSFIINVKYKKANFRNVKNIIIFRPDNLGDFILSIPAINSIRKQFPDSKLTCVVNPDSHMIASRICDRVIDHVSPYVHSKGLENDVNFHYILKKLKELSSTKYDLIVDLRSDIMSLAFAFISHAKYRIDASSRRLFSVFKKTLNIVFQKQILSSKKTHELDFICNVLEKSNIKTYCNFDLTEILTSQDITHALELMPESLTKKQFVIFHPGASWEYRCWSHEKFAEVANLIIKKFNLGIIIVGSQNENEQANAVLSLIRSKENVINLCGKTNILDIIYLAKLSAATICNDSAIGHIVAMSGANTISLFGAQDPEIFGPRGKNVFVIKKEIDCSPCAQIHCIKPKGGRCMDLINVSDVMNIVDKIFSKNNTKEYSNII